MYVHLESQRVIQARHPERKFLVSVHPAPGPTTPVAIGVGQRSLLWQLWNGPLVPSMGHHQDHPSTCATPELFLLTPTLPLSSSSPSARIPSTLERQQGAWPAAELGHWGAGGGFCPTHDLSVTFSGLPTGQWDTSWVHLAEARVRDKPHGSHTLGSQHTPRGLTTYLEG